MGGGLRELGPTPERRLPELHRSACCHTSNGALTSIRKTFLANSHSKDSRAPNTSGSRSRAQSEGTLLSTRKVPHAQLSAISLKCKEFDTEAASKLRLPKQHLPTDKDRGARYRGMKVNSKHIPNKIEQNRNNQKSSLNDLRWRGGRLPQRTWTNTREKVARIARV